MICNDPACGCAITSETLSVSGSGTPADPWVIEQLEFTILTEIENALANLAAEMNGLPGVYVAKAGDSMTGPLSITSAVHQLALYRTGSDSPHMSLYRADGTRLGYLIGTTDTIMLTGEAGVHVRFSTDAIERVRILASSGILLVGKTASVLGTTGSELAPTGQALVTRSATGINFRSNKTGAADANGQAHMDFMSAGAGLGSITRATASTVAYNTSSDETWKTNIFEVDDELAEYWARLVQPMFFEFIATPGDVHAGYIAQRLAAVWPEAIALGIVTPGYGTQDDRTFDGDGNETTPDGVYRQWMIDLSKMVPFIHAAWQATDRRVMNLTDRVDRLELALEGAAGAIAELQKR